MLRRFCRAALDAYYGFNRNDGWALASHIAMSALMALFPFIILVTALAASFLGSKELADEVARILLETWPRADKGALSLSSKTLEHHPQAKLLEVAQYLRAKALDTLITTFGPRMAACSPEQQWYQRGGRRTCRPNCTNGTSSGVCIIPHSDSRSSERATRTCSVSPLCEATEMACCSELRSRANSRAKTFIITGLAMERP